MAIRWVICPVITTPKIDPDTGLPGSNPGPRRAKIADMGFDYSAMIDTQGRFNWCLCFVRADDFAPLDAESEVINVLERDYEDGENFLATSPRDNGWNQGRINRVKNVLSSRNVDVTPLGLDTPLWRWLEAVGDFMDAPSMTAGRYRKQHPTTGQMIEFSGDADDQRAKLGQKVVGYRPKGVWVN